MDKEMEKKLHFMADRSTHTNWDTLSQSDTQTERQKDGQMVDSYWWTGREMLQHTAQWCV